MKFLNNTSNQHFLSQVEQRLNSSTPHASQKNQKIFSFEIKKDLFTEKRKLNNPTEKSIPSNLSINDLFSFDIEPKANLRHNFENIFHQYERSTHIHTEALLTKVQAMSSDISVEVKALFSAKFLNFMRNPYSVTKILNSFRGVVPYRPTDPELDRLFDLVKNGRKPHQKTMCRRLGISDAEYENWLGVLFITLSQLPPIKETIFEGLVRSMFDGTKHIVGVLICTYTREKCLLSDRSFSTMQQTPETIIIDFNLRHDAFIRYIFTKSTSSTFSSTINLNRNTIFPISVFHRVDDITLLRTFNANVINQSHNHVFCAVKDGIIF